MDPFLALLSVAALLVVTLVAGLALRRDRAHRRTVRSDEVVDPTRLGADGLGQSATLLQFSTEMCSRCPGMHRVLSTIAEGHDGVRHLDVDLTHRPDIARHFHVLQTPTTLVLDSAGRVRTRFGGTPGRDVIELELTRIAEEAALA